MFHLFLDYPNIDFRHVVMPSSKLDQSSNYPYDFTPAEINAFISQGYQDGETALKTGAQEHLQMIKEKITSHQEGLGRTKRVKKSKHAVDM